MQPEIIVSGLNFEIYEVEGLFYLRGKNNGTDQLRDYHPAALCLCFHITQKRFSHETAHI